MALSQIITTQIVRESVTGLKAILKPNNVELITTAENLNSSLSDHCIFVQNSTKHITFKDLAGNRKLNDVYVELNIQLQPKRLRFKEQKLQKHTIEEILQQTDEHLVILGGPGAGKTTTVKRICQLSLSGTLGLPYNLPILIYLRDITDSESIYSKLKAILGIEIASKDQNKTVAIDNAMLRERYISNYLNSLRIILILDGLDEVSPVRIKFFTNEIKSLMLTLNNSRVILTSRSASYNMSIENSHEYELCDLDEDQINDFVSKWFTNSEDSDIFIEKLRASKFFDLSLRPLTLAHLCAIFEKTKKFYDKPKSIYRKLVRLLIEEWDEQRGIVRESQYGDFDNERKFDFLSHFAFDLTVSYSHKIYSEDDFVESYKRIYSTYQLPLKDGDIVIKEIEDHTGIIIKSSYDSYEFVHKSMQEYLAAEYIVRLVNIPVKLIFDTNISNEIAIATSLSSNPNEYLYKLVFEVFKPQNLSGFFVLEFVSRLAYENPVFKESILIPYAFIYLFDLSTKKIDVFDRDLINFDFDDKYTSAISDLLIDVSNRKSFRKFKEYVILDRISHDSAYIYLDEDIQNEFTDDEEYYIDITRKYIVSETLYNNFLK